VSWPFNSKQRHLTMTEAVIVALEAELKRVKEKESQGLGVDDLVAELRALGKPGGRDMTKDEIDAMWGHQYARSVSAYPCSTKAMSSLLRISPERYDRPLGMLFLQSRGLTIM
jgi:antitoxin VapB